MIRYIYIGLLSIGLLLTGLVQAQTQPIEPQSEESDTQNNDNDKPERSSWGNGFVVGGNLGAQFGSSTYIEVSPLVGYRITDMLIGGVGLTYQYYRENYDVPTFLDYSASVIGPRVFLQHELVFNFFAHAEFEHTWVKWKYEDPTYGELQIDASALFVGPGYSYEVSDFSRFQIMVLYDLLNSVESIYYNPWTIRMGFMMDL